MTEQQGSGSRSAQRRARREFIRAHHPDAGGNDQTFITGLADFDAVPRPTAPAETGPVTSPETLLVSVTAEQAWPVSLTTAMIRRLRLRYRTFRAR